MEQSESSHTLENAGRLKIKGSGLWSWTRIDAFGREIPGGLDKYAIMRRLEIDARDLRILDPQFSYPSTILAREKAILVNLEHIRAIITTKEVLICASSNDNVTPVMEELQRRLRPSNNNQEEELMLQHDLGMSEEDDLPFEFQALEVAVEAICTYLDAHTTELETAFYPALDMITSKINSSNLDRIRKLKNQLTKLTARVQRVRDELEQILDNHDHMVNLCLSRRLVGTSPGSGFDAANPALSTTGLIKISCGVSRTSLAAVHGDENDVGELEMLLEAYFVQIDRTLNKLTTLREYVGSTQDFINIQLEQQRNQLLQLELFLSAGTLCINMMSVVAGLFGVNIPYKWNYGHGYMYKWVLITAGTFSGLVFVIIISQARRRGLVG